MGNEELKHRLEQRIHHLTNLELWDGLNPDEKRELADAQVKYDAILIQERKAVKDEGEIVAVNRQRARWRGKNYERRVAKLIKGVVVGRSKAVKVQGRWIQTNCQKPPDVVNEWLSVECKYWKELPVWLDKVMTQAVRNAPKNLIPVGWVGDRESKVNYVIMLERDFLDLHI